MKNQLRIHKLNKYSRGILLTDWLKANEIVNDTIYEEVTAEISSNQIILTLPPPVNARSAPQVNNEECPTGSHRERGGGWTELSEEELEAKYPDYPTKLVKDTALLDRKLSHMIDDMAALDRRVDALSAAVETLQASKKGETS
jgi:hypothetical protein